MNLGKGLGDFVRYHQKGGLPSKQSPIIVDGVSSETFGKD